MSIAISLKDWETQVKRRITAELRFQAKQTYLPGQRFQPKPEHLIFWRSEKGMTYVPLNYGMYVQNNPSCVDPREGLDEEQLVALKPTRLPDPKGTIDIEFTADLLEEKGQPAVVEEAKEKLSRSHTVLLHLPTGKGKTTVAIYLSAFLKKKTMILVESKHVKGWKETISKRTSGFPWVFKPEGPASWIYKASCFVNGEWVVDEAMKKKKNVKRLWEVGTRKNGQKKLVVEPNGYTHVIVTPGMFFSKDPRSNKKLLQFPQQLIDLVGLMIVDEVHNYYTQNSISIFTAVQPEYFIACSATPRKGKKRYFPVLYAMVGEENTVYRPLDEEFVMVKYNTRVPLLLGSDPKDKGYWGNLQAAQCEDLRRNRIAVEIIKAHPGRKVMVITWRNKQHVPVISKLLTEEGISNSEYTGTMKSYPDAQVLISTINKGGEGFDQESACSDYDGKRIDLVIVTVTMDSVELFQQVIGRAVGRAHDPWIVVLSDINNTCDKHLTKMYGFVKKQPRATFFEMNHGDEWPELEATNDEK